MTTPDSSRVQIVSAPGVSDTASAQIQNQQKSLGRLTEQIDHILFTEWDPIGVHLLTGFDCVDEYQSYTPIIVDMVIAGDTFSEISDQLMVFEGYIKGADKSSRRRCDVIAVMVSRYGPHYTRNHFIPTVSAATPEASYRSVMDLVIQTRLDAYEGNWDAVRGGYELAVSICRTHLVDQDQLLTVCLNNLGQAYSMLGNLEKAEEMLEAAVSLLASQESADESSYLRCLDNLITNFEHRGMFSEAEHYLKAMVACLERTADDGDERISDARIRLLRLAQADKPAINLSCSRLSVAGDGFGEILNVVVID